METSQLTTSFIALDERDLGSFAHVSFRTLEKHAREVIKSAGIYHITVTIECDENLTDKAQALELEKVA